MKIFADNNDFNAKDEYLLAINFFCHVKCYLLFLRPLMPAKRAMTPKVINAIGIMTLIMSMNMYQLRMIPKIPSSIEIIPMAICNIVPPFLTFLFFPFYMLVLL